jgi:aspartate kinase
VTFERFGEAEPLMELSLYQIDQTLGPLLTAGEVPVVTGYIAATQHGITTTLGRGGSDYTATLLGAALKAEEIWIWSDVDGLMSADPRIVPEARRLECISFGEAVEMAQFGAKAMHPRALEPAAERGIPVRMKNAFNPEAPGTLVADETGAPGAVARSIHLVRDAGLITVAGAAMIGHAGTAARVCQALADRGINIRMISQSVSEAGISLAVCESAREGARRARGGSAAHRGGATRAGREGRRDRGAGGRRNAGNARGRGARVRGGRQQGDQRDRDRAGILRAQHLVRGAERSGPRGRAGFTRGASGWGWRDSGERPDLRGSGCGPSSQRRPD